MNANIKTLTDKHGDNAVRVSEEIADLGGYGAGNTHYIGGFDILGALDPSNTTIPDKAKERIAELSGISRKSVDKYIASGVIIPPDQFEKEIEVPRKT